MGCPEPDKGITTDPIAELGTWLAAQPANTAAAPYAVTLKVDSLGGYSDTAGSLGYVLRANGSKYLRLDLSGSNLTRIEESAFDLCANLTAITIPDGVTRIGYGAFFNCSSLAAVTIPDSVTSIGGYAFSHCTNLASVTIPSGVTSIGGYAFSNCTSLATVAIPDSVTSIGELAFSSCSLASVTIPSGVTSIGGYAFCNCTSLASVTFAGTINSDKFGGSVGPSTMVNFVYPFDGDLRNKFYATNSSNGTPGTYTTTAPVGTASVWTKQ
jgi:hypothetical protein